MSLLQLKMRPWTEFDPTDSDHRRWYAEYLETGTWGHCPVRFVDPTDCGNLAAALQNSLVRYYAKKEFRNASKRAKKVFKTVDNLAV